MSFIKILPLLISLIVGVGLYQWMSISKRDVGGMGVPVPKPVASTEDQEKSLKGELLKGKGVPSKKEGDWPCFRGPDLTGISQSKVPLLKTWPSGGPKQIWEIELAKGHGGAVVFKGRVYVLDYDSTKLRDVLRCLSLDNGEEIWSFSYPIKTKTYHGITRSVPSVNEKYVVSIGPKGQVYCLDSMTGEFKWSKSLVLEYGSEMPKWYSGQCPLLEGDAVVLAPCGTKAFVVKLDCESGEAIWTAKNTMLWEMTHTSVMPMTLEGGLKTYVYSGSGGVAAVDAESGKKVWTNRVWKVKIAACASPLVIDQHRLFLSAGYSAGAMMIKIYRDDSGEWQADKLFKLEEKVFGSVQHTPILYQDHIFGTRPNGEMVCIDLEGNLKWNSGTEKFGIGPFMAVQDLLYVLDSKTCKLSLIELNVDEYKVLSQAELYPGHDAYGLMAMVNGWLIVRDLKKMVCLDISAAGKNI